MCDVYVGSLVTIGAQYTAHHLYTTITLLSYYTTIILFLTHISGSKLLLKDAVQVRVDVLEQLFHLLETSHVEWQWLSLFLVGRERGQACACHSLGNVRFPLELDKCSNKPL